MAVVVADGDGDDSGSGGAGAAAGGSGKEEARWAPGWALRASPERVEGPKRSYGNLCAKALSRGCVRSCISGRSRRRGSSPRPTLTLSARNGSMASKCVIRDTLRAALLRVLLAIAKYETEGS
ncbi:PREDICTED: uncharacterized protein LOC106748208 isoform X1 [Dinoponera quadriceps]|uniref:Uncharacterized protein LOC106748208 isoform X1 n=1 Tax=Dinoponera quadriceps TaxID=609295 RepID=A0A6P3XV78_DINQU|nr:PREDICTED: uncharacterized protein LOC106748208 isoform X1 [Dinoponera quadriceps]